MQAKLLKKYDLYKEKEGTRHQMIDESDKANQARAEETDIRLMIQKYGIMPFEMMNQAKENLYLDMRGESMTINEKLKMKQQVDDYFNQLPANVRKNYADNKELFYEQIITGEFEQLIKDNVFTEQQANNYAQIQKEQLGLKIDKFKEEILNEYQNNIASQESVPNNSVSTENI